MGRRVQAGSRGNRISRIITCEKCHNETCYFLKNKNKKNKVTFLFCAQMYEDVASIGHNMGGRGTFLRVKIGLNFFSGSQFEFGSMFENLKNFHFLLPISSYPAIMKRASRYLLPRLHCVCVQAGD